MNNKVYKFSGFTLDVGTRQLSNEKGAIQLSSRAFDILHYLVQRRGEVVTKEDIMNTIWKDAFVEEGNLAVHISSLRKALGEKKGQTKFIDTVSGRGYCFTAVFDEANIYAQSVSAPPATNNFVQSTTLKEHSIAVFPFSFKSDKSSIEYLAFGITDGLINNLSKIPSFKVMSRSATAKYTDDSFDLFDVGKQLGVDTILTGNILEFDEQFILSTELVNVSDKRHLWGTEYNCRPTDILEARKEISLGIAEKLSAELSDTEVSALSKIPTANKEAYILYLKGKHLLDIAFSPENMDDLYIAIDFLQQALNKDPKFAAAYVELALVYLRLLVFSKTTAKEAGNKINTLIEKALSLDPNLSDAYRAKGLYAKNVLLNVKGAETFFRRSIELDASNSSALNAYSSLLGNLGIFEEAITIQKRALEIDPLSERLNSYLAVRHYFARNYQECIEIGKQNLAFLRDNSANHFYLAVSYAQLKDYEKAIEHHENALKLNDSNEFLSGYGHTLAISGKTKQAEQVLTDLLGRVSEDDSDYTELACLLAALDKKNEALQVLDTGLKNKCLHIQIIGVDPRLDSLRDDPRFSSILKKINLI